MLVSQGRRKFERLKMHPMRAPLVLSNSAPFSGIEGTLWASIWSCSMSECCNGSLQKLLSCAFSRRLACNYPHVKGIYSKMRVGDVRTCDWNSKRTAQRKISHAGMNSASQSSAYHNPLDMLSFAQLLSATGCPGAQ